MTKQIPQLLWGVWMPESKIGSGAYGTVYRAVREEYGKQYYSAVKHISIPMDESNTDALYQEGYASDANSIQTYYERMRDNILSEIELMYRLRGIPNIVAYEDHLVVPKKDSPGYDLFVRMELLHGLNDVFRQGSVSVQEVCRLGVDICMALEALEKMNIIHRDIKPANILRNDLGTYKLADFGVARQMEHAVTLMSKKGTPSYMAPEVFKGEKADRRSDIYCLGLVMYKLLNNNRLPFLSETEPVISSAEHDEAFVRRIQGEKMQKPLYADVELWKVIEKACAYNPEARYASASAFRAAIEHYRKRCSAAQSAAARDKTFVLGPHIQQSIPTLLCKTCSAPLEPGAAFCGKCGTPAQPLKAVRYCTECGTSVSGNTPLCERCAAAQKPVQKKKKTGTVVLWVAASFTALLACAVLVFAVGILKPGNSQSRNKEKNSQTDGAAVLSGGQEENKAVSAPTETPAAVSTPVQTRTPVSTPATDMPKAFTDFSDGTYTLYTADSEFMLFADMRSSSITLKATSYVQGCTVSVKEAQDGVYTIGTILGDIGTVSQGGWPKLQKGQSGKWRFATDNGWSYYICLAEEPQYVLGYSGGIPAVELYEAGRETQQWIVAAAQDAAASTDQLANFICSLNTRNISMEEIYGFDQKTMGYIRNGIYALSGKIFRTEEYRAYFSQQPWYYPISEDGDLIEKQFNQYQEHNLNVCLDYEKMMGWR